MRRWLADEEAGRDDGRPEAVLVALGRLHDAARLDDAAAHAVDLLALVVVLVGVELDAEQGREHRRREVLAVVARLLRGLAEGVVLGEVPELPRVAGAREADRGRDETVGLARLGV